MKKAIKVIVVVLCAAFIVLQFFRIDKANPPINEAETLEASAAVSPDISLIFGRACNDCHSNKTVWPWYSNVQPAAWFLKDHIDDGKRHLNFSVFNTYETKKKVKKLEEICDEVKSGNMPLPSYLWIHWDAKLTDSEKAAICSWTAAEIAKMEK